MKNAKKYNQLIEFWIANNISNGQGGFYSSYTLDFVDYAHVKTKDETRTLQENQLILEGYYEVYLRFRDDVNITKSHNIKMKGKDLTIHSIVNIDELNKEIKLICSESDNNTIVPEGENPFENYQ